MKKVDRIAHLNLCGQVEDTTSAVQNGRWKDFWRDCRRRNVYIVGCGKMAGKFITRYGEKCRIAGGIDNVKGKLGETLGDIAGCECAPKTGGLKIYLFDELRDEEYREGVFLITPLQGYGGLERQLLEHGCQRIYSYFMMESKTIHCKGQMFLEKKGVYEWFKVYEFYRNRRYRINEKKIVFSAFGTYCDHGKYITEELLKKKETYDLVWVVYNDEVKVPPGVRMVMRWDVEKYIYEMSTAKIWIFNSPVQAYVRKRKGQIYIQTKHWTGITLKKFYLDAGTVTQNKDRVRLWKRNARMMDYVITASEFDTQSCMRGFRPKGKCVELGSARTDILFDGSRCRKKIRGMLNLPQDSKLLMYAPTYRFQWSGVNYEQSLPEYDIDYNVMIDELEKKFHGKWYVLLRLHPGLRGYGEQLCLNDRMINISAYPDGEEFIAACDILISDYSSIMFEPAYVKKPVFLYATDIDAYLKNDYELLLDIRSLPFPLAENNEQLMQNIRNFDREQYEARLTEFLDSFHTREDGQACRRITAFIKDLLS